jgi:hypothetical protein
MEISTVSKESCELHRQLIEEKIKGVDGRIGQNEKRTDDIMDEIKGIRDMQKQTLYVLVFIACGVILTLCGVILGRGLDFGWIVTGIT